MIVGDDPRANVSDHIERILGIDFFNGSAEEAATSIGVKGGVVVVPSSPALTKLRYDESYRRALQQADLVLPDSGLLAFLWRRITGGAFRKISGIDYLSQLLDRSTRVDFERTFWIVSSETAKEKAMLFLRTRGLAFTNESFGVLVPQAARDQQHALLLQLEQGQPRHVVIALRSGVQEELGIYLRDYLLYHPAIHCVGDALGFLTGDEAGIPAALERRHLGWLARLRHQPGMVLPRLGSALLLAVMVFRYRSDLPPLTKRWADR